MLPAYRVEVLEYTDYTEDSEGVTKSKPHIIFDDPELEPLAEILNWQFPDPQRLRHSLEFLLRPWHPAVTARNLRVNINSFLELRSQGQAIVLQWDELSNSGIKTELESIFILDIYAEAIRLAQRLSAL